MGFPAKNGLTYKVSSVNVVMETMCGIIRKDKRRFLKTQQEIRKTY